MLHDDRLARHDLLHPDGRALHVYGDRPGPFGRAASAPGGGRPAPAGRLQRRLDRISGAWVLVSPARNHRPGGRLGTGPVDGAADGDDGACPLCPGGPELPAGYELAVFDNRFPSMAPDAPGQSGGATAASVGRCQVVVYTPEHTGSIGSLPPQRLAAVVAVWRDRATALWSQGYRYVMAFENRGRAVGATLAHPHGQLYAFGHEPPTVVVQRDAHRAHRARHRACLGCALVADDESAGRVVRANPSFVVAVPFAARWPFECHVRARRHGAGRLADLDGDEQRDLARALFEVVACYDGLFGFELPFMLCVREAPAGADGRPDPDWHLWVELLPPHRDQDRLKVRAAVETSLGTFINDTVPEESARRMAAVAVPAPDWRSVRVPVIVGPGD